jgi:hypothetical protein
VYRIIFEIFLFPSNQKMSAQSNIDFSKGARGAIVDRHSTSVAPSVAGYYSAATNSIVASTTLTSTILLNALQYGYLEVINTGACTLSTPTSAEVALLLAAYKGRLIVGSVLKFDLVNASTSTNLVTITIQGSSMSVPIAGCVPIYFKVTSVTVGTENIQML